MTDRPILSFKQDDSITTGVVQSVSVLDALNVQQFGHELQQYVRAHRGIHLLLNFEHVSHLSSAVLTELLRLKRTIENVEGTLRLCGLSEDIQKVFEITNLEKVFHILPDTETAVEHYKRSLQVAAEDDAWADI